MRIDAHQHFWKYHPRKQPWIDDSMAVIQRDFMPDELRTIYQKSGIDGCIAVQADQSLDETDFLLDLAANNEFIRGIVGWADLRGAGIEKVLEQYHQHPKLKGWRHIVQEEEDHNFLLRPDFLSGISFMKKYNCVYDILIFPHQLGAALEFVKHFPNQKFVIDHIAKPYIKDGFYEGWATLMQAMAQYENVYCKLSGMITEADHNSWTPKQIHPYMEFVLDTFGTNRVMYGSDWPVCLLAGGYDAVLGLVRNFIAHLSDTEQQAIMGKNAIEFYNLK